MKHKSNDEGNIRRMFFEVLAASDSYGNISLMPLNDSNGNSKTGDNRQEGASIPEEIAKRRTSVFMENQRGIMEMLQKQTIEILRQESLLTSDEMTKLMQLAALSREHGIIKDNTFDLYIHPRMQ